MPTSLTDLKQMSDADIVTSLWELLYEQEKAETFNGELAFIISPEEMESIRQFVDELEYRWSVRPHSQKRAATLYSTLKDPASQELDTSRSQSPKA